MYNVQDNRVVRTPRSVSISDLLTSGLLTENDIRTDGTVNELARNMAEREFMQTYREIQPSENNVVETSRRRIRRRSMHFLETSSYEETLATLRPRYRTPKIRVSHPHSLTFESSNSLGDNSTHEKGVQTDFSDSNICCICLMNPRNRLLLPCSHMCVCEDCAHRIEQCPICRSEIFDVYKIYL